MQVSIIRLMVLSASLLVWPNNAASQSPVVPFFNDLAGFNDAAGSPPIVVDFDQIPPDTSVDALTISGVTFSTVTDPSNAADLLVVAGADTFTPSGFLNVLDPAANKLFPTSGAQVLSPGGLELGPGPDPFLQADSLLLVFDPPVAAVGFDILFQQLDAFSFVGITALGSDGEVLFESSSIPAGSSVSAAPGGSVFVGLVSGSANIQAVVVSESDENEVFPDSNIGYDTVRFR